MALGARASETKGMILREGVEVTAIGVCVGLVLALAIGKLLSGLLYEVRSLEPLY
jgi:ABC-type antimicrobial peptide transport system permease subunit